jgi:hypothetical protein
MGRIQIAPDTEFSETFVEGMAARMAMSYFKYGAVAEAYPLKRDAIASLQQRLLKYAETGNTEWLIDVANFAMIEFMHPRHPHAHFSPTDADESPGRTHLDGRVSAEANTLSRENIRRGGSNRRTDGGFYTREGD